MAGRHGNKGVVSRILPEEDMPYTAGRWPVDVVLNPLGVLSYECWSDFETHLGWAAKNLGEKLNEVMEQAFNRENLENVFGYLEHRGLRGGRQGILRQMF